MKTIHHVMCLCVTAVLIACAGLATPFPGSVVAPPMDLAGRWQLELNGQTSHFALAPAGRHHYRVTSPGGADPAVMDASIQAYRGAHYLVLADAGGSGELCVFRVLDVTPAALRIAALDPARTAAVLRQRGLPVGSRKMWRYDEVALTGPALQAVLALPPADVFALGDGMTLTRLQ